MHKLRKQSRSNKAVQIFTLTSKMGLIKNEKEFPFNDFGDFAEDKWNIFLFPPLTLPTNWHFSHYHNKTAIWGRGKKF